MRRALAPLPLLAVLAAGAAAGELPGALLVLEVLPPGSPGRYPEAAPPRFVLLEKGQFFVGGSSELAAGRFESSELKQLEERVERLRRLQGLGSQVALGPGATRYRLRLLGKRPLEILATGEPATAPPAVQPLATLLADLARLQHPSQRFVRADGYLLTAREGSLAGGCRPWTFGFAPNEAASGRAVGAAEAAGWPHGVHAASACEGGRRYVVTLRPLLPGERP